MDFKVDHVIDGGGENGNYPIGWPRVRRDFAPKEVVLTDYDYLIFNVKFDSDRDDSDNGHTPFGVVISSYEGGSDGFKGGVDLDFADKQREWLPQRISIRNLIDKSGRSPDTWKHLKGLQFCIAEKDYKHHTNIKFYLDDIALIKFKHPIIEDIVCLMHLTLPAKYLKIGINGLGFTNSAISKDCLIRLSMTDANGKNFTVQDFSFSQRNKLALNLSGMQPGIYTLTAVITDKAGKELSRKTRTVEAINGFI